jgi:hypothetical protein
MGIRQTEIALSFATCEGLLSADGYDGTVEIAPSAPCRTRTYNPLIKSQLLCQLS